MTIFLGGVTCKCPEDSGGAISSKPHGLYENGFVRSDIPHFAKRDNINLLMIGRHGRGNFTGRLGCTLGLAEGERLGLSLADGLRDGDGDGLKDALGLSEGLGLGLNDGLLD